MFRAEVVPPYWMLASGRRDWLSEVARTPMAPPGGSASVTVKLTLRAVLVVVPWLGMAAMTGAALACAPPATEVPTRNLARLTSLTEMPLDALTSARALNMETGAPT